jgi:hypothetical protein
MKIKQIVIFSFLICCLLVLQGFTSMTFAWNIPQKTTLKNFSYDDLSIITLLEDGKILTFNFVRANSGGFEHSLARKTRFDKSIDVIRFSYNGKLIRKLIKKGCKPWLYTEGGFEIPAKKWKIFFTSIQQLEDAGENIFISADSINLTLSQLLKNKYLKEKDTLRIKSTIQPHLLLKDYEEKAKSTRNVKKAISLAIYYRDNERSLLAVHWLCEAKKYLGEKSITEIVDLQEFLQKIDTIDSTIFSLGDKEIFNAATRCSSIRTLYLGDSINQQICNNIGSFLGKTSSIEEVRILRTPYGNE